MLPLDRVAEAMIARGDLAHLALLLWAGGTSLFALAMLRELSATNRRFDDFGRELAHFNRRHAPAE